MNASRGGADEPGIGRRAAACLFGGITVTRGPARSAARGLIWLAAALLAASCAPIPPPTAPPAPPIAKPPAAKPQPAEVPGVPQEFKLEREPSIDVGLGWDLDSLSLVPVQRTSLGVSSGSGAMQIGATMARIEPRLAARGWQVSLRERGGRPLVRSLGSADTLWVGDERAQRGARPGSATGIGWQGSTWRGRLKVFLNPRGKLTLATRVPLETYLLGVVPAEIGGLKEELIEAGRAQAIAARSYTLFYRGRRAAEGFDLYGTVEDQVYAPVESERPLATRCVEGTHGELAISSGSPIRANYCSTCGGISADVWEGWPTAPMPYLTSHRDAGSTGDYCASSPQYRWREEWPAAEFLKNLTTFTAQESVAVPAQGVGELEDVRVAERSRSGRVWRLVIETSTGEITVPAYVLRRVLRRAGNPKQILRSNLFKIDVRRDPGTRRAVSVVASGAGSGHGVGLCQTGAIGMARAGSSAESILLHYYPAIELHRFY